MKQGELDLILIDHAKFLRGEGGKKANLLGANLHRADLYEANLRGADLSGANLREANLRGANLLGANLYEANLYEANLSGANLLGANLYGTNLYEADLSGADLYEANLYEADLYGASLHGADFKCDGEFHHLTNVGSENGTLELYSCGDSGWYVKRGCFSGTKDEFLTKVKQTHKDNEYAIKYNAIINLFCE